MNRHTYALRLDSSFGFPSAIETTATEQSSDADAMRLPAFEHTHKCVYTHGTPPCQQRCESAACEMMGEKKFDDLRLQLMRGNAGPSAGVNGKRGGE